MKRSFLWAALVALAWPGLSGAATERRFQAEIVAVDAARQTLRLRHKPTGYEVEVYWDERTRTESQSQCDLDEIPEGWVTLWVKEADPAARMIAGIGRVLPADGPPDGPQDVAPKTLFVGRLIREPLPPGTASPATLLTAKGDAAYSVEIGGERWTVRPDRKRPRLIRSLPMSAEDFRVGLGLREAIYLEEPSGNRLVSATGAAGNFSPPGEIGGGTGTSAERLASEMARLRGARAKVSAEIRETAPVSMRVEPEIALPGEPVRVVMEAWADRSPGTALTLRAGYLRPDATPPAALRLDWKAREREGGLTRHVAELELPALPVGQHLVEWGCDIGGDIPEFWRSFAVADRGALVVMLHFTAGTPNREFEEFRLPYDYWEEAAMKLLGGPLGDRPTPASAAAWVGPSREYRRRGAMPSTHIVQGNYAGRTGWPAPIPVQFLREPPEVQRAVLSAAAELAPMLGFRAEEMGCTGYEFGTRSVDLAREAGIRLIGSMCIHQNWQDGSWGINHTGRPLRPYFAAQDDFRKAGPGGPGGVVMVSQHDKSLLWTEYGVGVFEPAWIERAWVGGGGGGRAECDDIFMSRHYDLLEASLQNTANQKVPYFASIGIEFSRADPEEPTTKANGLMLRHVAGLAARRGVVFCNQSAAADFYRRHYRETPETLFYDPDFWCGTKADDSIVSTWKPLDYPDLMQVENARCSAFFKRPAALPEYHWDYSAPWDFPDWGNEGLPRSPAGFLVPGEHDKFAVTPSITDTRGMEVSETRAERPGGLDVLLRVRSDRRRRAFPVALWDLPREWKAGEGWWKTDGAARFVPVRAPFTGNLCGILELDVQPGDNLFRLAIETPARRPLSQDIRLDSLRAKVFEREGQSMAYLWPTRPWETEFELEIPGGARALYFAAPEGERVELAPGRHRLRIAKESWARLIGLGVEALSAALRPPAR